MPYGRRGGQGGQRNFLIWLPERQPLSTSLITRFGNKKGNIVIDVNAPPNNVLHLFAWTH